MAIQSSSGGSKPPAPKRLVAPEATAAESDGGRDEGLRPRRLCDYIGQSELKQVLGIAVEATRLRNDALDHVLLYGPPGLGKTTMALVLAEELGVSCRIASAPALERPRDIVGLLMNLQPRELLFIDEIHRLNRVAKSCSIQRWRIFASISPSALVQRPAPAVWSCRPSPWWGRPPKPGP